MMATLGEEEEEREFMAIFGQSLEYQKEGRRWSSQSSSSPFLIATQRFPVQCCPRAVAESNLLSAHN